VKDLERQVSRQFKKMESAPTGEKLKYRPALLKLSKEKMQAEAELEKVQTEAKDIRSKAEKLEPLWIKKFKAFIRMSVVRE
jgi:hypothetical protein